MNGSYGGEMWSLKKNETRDLVHLSHGKRAIGCKWVYKKQHTITEKRRGKVQGSLSCKGVFTTDED